MPCLKYYTYKLFCCTFILRKCCLFTDDEFNDIALGDIPDTELITWRRCYENKDCKFIVDNIHPNDVIQGQIGNCWLMIT